MSGGSQGQLGNLCDGDKLALSQEIANRIEVEDGDKKWMISLPSLAQYCLTIFIGWVNDQ